MDFLTHYRQLCDAQKIIPDPAQNLVAEKLSALGHVLKTYHLSKWKLFAKAPPQGLYLYGEVGRGKTMLMDLFYEHQKGIKKTRLHFYDFMKNVHLKLEHERQENKSPDPIKSVARKIAHETTLLCFDEFQVSNIVDAMILGRLFEYLFDLGVVVIFTTNFAPDGLYPDGLQRELFLPFIDLIKKRMDIVELDHDQDYRFRHGILKQVYFKTGDPQLETLFKILVGKQKISPHTLIVQGHAFVIPETAGKVAKCTFEDMCAQTYGAMDYVMFATHYDIIFITDIPRLSGADRNLVKRFIMLVDAFYEHRVKLILSAESAMHDLYQEGEYAFEFKRTFSRLTEMVSPEYLKLEHLT